MDQQFDKVLKELRTEMGGYRRKQPKAEDTRENMEGCAEDSVNENIKDSAKNHIKENAREKRMMLKMRPADFYILAGDAKISFCIFILWAEKFKPPDGWPDTRHESVKLFL